LSAWRAKRGIRTAAAGRGGNVRAISYKPPMSEESQIRVPASFDALHRDARHRLTVSLAELRARSELCEDMAQMLVDRAQALHHDQGVDEPAILRRMQAGLASPDAGFSVDEAGWVTTRLAELLDWPWPGRPTQPEAPRGR
jgi:hypothetical protein